jgi:hypothetical protein
MCSPLGYVGSGTPPISGHRLRPLWAPINHEHFSPFRASRPLYLALFILCCVPTAHIHDLFRGLLVFLPATHTFVFSFVFPYLQVAKAVFT